MKVAPLAACISQDGMLCCGNKHPPSVSRQKQCRFLTYITYPRMEGSDSCDLYSETQAEGGSSTWNFTWYYSGKQSMRDHTRVFSASAERRHTSLLLNFIDLRKAYSQI